LKDNTFRDDIILVTYPPAHTRKQGFQRYASETSPAGRCCRNSSNSREIAWAKWFMNLANLGLI